MVKVKIIGAGGYGGVGIAELLLGHPEANIQTLVDVENTGTPISELYPHMAGALDSPLVAPDSNEAKANVDVVFMATPDGVGMKLAESELKNGAKVIDYSGDFRFNSVEDYEEYATRIGRESKHASPDILSLSVYGLPELHRKSIDTSRAIVGNPGCFAVSCILGLAPAVAEGLIELSSIVCDCKTGASGAGRKPSEAFHFPARQENMNAYKLAGHQHVCEIERELGRLSGSPLKITFTAQVVPATRGIMSTLYATLSPEQNQTTVLDAYRTFYKEEPFVRIYDSTSPVGTVHVRGTNRANLVLGVDERTNRFRCVSYIDNLMKGQAGSALQNMNLLFGLPETTGLTRPGMYP